MTMASHSPFASVAMCQIRKPFFSKLLSFQHAFAVFGNEILRHITGGVAEWLRRRVSNHARSTRVGSNPVVGATNHNPPVNSAVHPSEVGK